MALTIESWRPAGDNRTLWEILGGGGPTPQGDGWSITGYTPAQLSFGSGIKNVNVPTYQRIVGQPEAASAPPSAAQPAPAPAQPKVTAQDPKPLNIGGSREAYGALDSLYSKYLGRNLTQKEYEGWLSTNPSIGGGWSNQMWSDMQNAVINSDEGKAYKDAQLKNVDWSQYGNVPNGQPNPSLMAAGFFRAPSSKEEMRINSPSAVAGNATGFTRARSSARKSGLATKGTSRFRINRAGQTSASSGLNIGV